MDSRNNIRYKVVSLFSGCGGGDLGFLGGFESIGHTYDPLPFDLLWANDVDEFACAVYRMNLGQHIRCSDISKLRFENLEVGSDEVDVVLGGFPCQEFSLRGPRGGLHAPRGKLYKHMRRAIRHFRPKIFLAENVPGIEYPPVILKTIIRGLSGRTEPKYRVEYYHVNAADYGVPQIRNRILIVGIRSDIPYNFVPPSAVHGSSTFALPNFPVWLTAYDALEDLWNPIGPNGHEVCDQEKITEATIHFTPHNRRDRRLKAELPAPIIRAEHHGHIEVHYNTQFDGSMRRLTVRECARLQGFPDSFVFPVSATQAYRQIGNAIPPVMMYHWAVTIKNWLEAMNDTSKKSS